MYRKNWNLYSSMDLCCEKIRNTSAVQANKMFLGRKKEKNRMLRLNFETFIRISLVLSLPVWRCTVHTRGQLCRRRTFMLYLWECTLHMGYVDGMDMYFFSYTFIFIFSFWALLIGSWHVRCLIGSWYIYFLISRYYIFVSSLLLLMCYNTWRRIWSAWELWWTFNFWGYCMGQII